MAVSDDTKRDDVFVIPEDYRITLPQRIREMPGFERGGKVAWLVKHGSVSLVPVLGLDELRGIARGADTSDLREKTDRF